MTLEFKRASKKAARLRMALIGPAGSGKTYTALRIAVGLGGRVAVLDTEHGSASKYADLFAFDVLEPDSFAPKTYVDAIRAAEAAGYDVLVIDSLSHAWSGKGGALEMVDNAARRSGGNGFAAWRDVTPQHNAMVDAMVGSGLHLIVTMRSKMEYAQEKDEKGRTVIRKVGLQPVQRDGLEYEFDVVADIDQDHYLKVTKTRCPALTDAVLHKPGDELAATLAAWLTDGAAAPQPKRAAERQVVTEADLEPATTDLLTDIAAEMERRKLPKKGRDQLEGRLTGGRMTRADAEAAMAWVQAHELVLDGAGAG